MDTHRHTVYCLDKLYMLSQVQHLVIIKTMLRVWSLSISIKQHLCDFSDPENSRSCKVHCLASDLFNSVMQEMTVDNAHDSTETAHETYMFVFFKEKLERTLEVLPF